MKEDNFITEDVAPKGYQTFKMDYVEPKTDGEANNEVIPPTEKIQPEPVIAIPNDDMNVDNMVSRIPKLKPGRGVITDADTASLVQNSQALAKSEKSFTNESLKVDSNWRDATFITANKFIPEQVPFMSEDEIASWGVDFMRQYDNDLVDMAMKSFSMGESEPEEKAAFGYMLEAFDRKDGTFKDGLKAAGYMITDPSNLVSFGTLGAGFFVKGGVKSLAKASFKEKMKFAAGVGAIDGAMFGMADDAIRQNTDINIWKKDQFDWMQSGISTGIGGVVGAGAGAGLYGAGHAVVKGISKVGDWAEGGMAQAAGGGVITQQMKVIHNLTKDNLEFVDNYFNGEIPAPSVAITDKDIPFESFGDISLIGDKDMINPKVGPNKVFGADAYTKRVPRASFDADIDELIDFKKLTAGYEKGYRIDGLSEGVLNGEKTPSQAAMEVRYSDDMKSIYKERTGKRYSEKSAKEWWKERFENIKGKAKFNSSDDYYNKKMKDYTADNIVKYIRKSPTTNSEGFDYGLGSVRASGLKELKSIKAIQERTTPLVSGAEMETFKNNLNDKFFELSMKLEPYSKYARVDSAALGDIIAGFMQGYKSHAITSDFNNIPKELLEELSTLGKELATAPTEYYEAKLLRGVDLNEFQGAIVPKGTPKRITDILRNKGVQVKLYDPKDVSNDREKVLQEFLNKNPNTLFMNPTVIGGAALGTAATQGEDNEN